MEVFPTTEALSVFLNEHGEITLKQEDAYGGDDRIVYVPLHHLDAVIRAMRMAAKDARRHDG